MEKEEWVARKRCSARQDAEKYDKCYIYQKTSNHKRSFKESSFKERNAKNDNRDHYPQQRREPVISTLNNYVRIRHDPNYIMQFEFDSTKEQGQKGLAVIPFAIPSASQT